MRCQGFHSFLHTLIREQREQGSPQRHPTCHCSHDRAFTLPNMKLYSWSSNLTRLSCLAPHIRGFGSHHGLLYAAFRRGYATQSTLGGSTTPSRKQITISNDDGRVQWKDLSRREKAARTTQQTFNLGLVLLGFFMTVRHITRREESSSYKIGRCCIFPLQRGLLRGQQDEPFQPRCRPNQE